MMYWYSWERIDFGHSCDLKGGAFPWFWRWGGLPHLQAMEKRPGDEVVFCRARLPSQNKVNLFEFSIYSHFFYYLKTFIDS